MDKQEMILNARQRFQAGQSIPMDCVRPEILASWERSRHFGVDPAHADKSILSEDEL